MTSVETMVPPKGHPFAIGDILKKEEVRFHGNGVGRQSIESQDEVLSRIEMEEEALNDSLDNAALNDSSDCENALVMDLSAEYEK